MTVYVLFDALNDTYEYSQITGKMLAFRTKERAIKWQDEKAVRRDYHPHVHIEEIEFVE